MSRDRGYTDAAIKKALAEGGGGAVGVHAHIY